MMPIAHTMWHSIGKRTHTDKHRHSLNRISGRYPLIPIAPTETANHQIHRWGITSDFPCICHQRGKRHSFFAECFCFDCLSHHENTFVKTSDVENIVNGLNNKVSKGPDCVPNKVLKKVGPGFRKALTTLLNQMINCCYTPQSWRFAVVCPIPKPGKPADDLNSYRPISLISNISKIWEKIILAKLSFWLKELRIIPDWQFGFTKQKKIPKEWEG